MTRSGARSCDRREQLGAGSRFRIAAYQPEWRVSRRQDFGEFISNRAARAQDRSHYLYSTSWISETNCYPDSLWSLRQ